MLTGLAEFEGEAHAESITPLAGAKFPRGNREHLFGVVLIGGQACTGVWPFGILSGGVRLEPRKSGPSQYAHTLKLAWTNAPLISHVEWGI